MPVFLERQDLRDSEWSSDRGKSITVFLRKEIAKISRGTWRSLWHYHRHQNVIFSIDSRVEHLLSANLRQNAQVFIKFRHIKPAWSASKIWAHRNNWEMGSDTKTISGARNCCFLSSCSPGPPGLPACVYCTINCSSFEGTYAFVVGQNFDQANVRTQLFCFPSTSDTSTG